MSRFWENTSEPVEELVSSHRPTILLSLDEQSENPKLVELDSFSDPLIALTWDDFKISELIKKGISYSALNITPDMRFGHEKEFEALEAKFSDLSSDFYKQEK